MGNYIYSLHKHSSNIPKSFKPSNFEWLSLHSLETGLSIVEIERLWVRFKQLGCDYNGYWSEQLVSNSQNKIARDGFQQQLMSQLQQSGEQYITFYDFVNAAVWLERSTIDEKLKASFAIINNNRPITEESLTKTLILMFPSKTKEEIDQFVEEIFDRIGVINPVYKVKEILEEDFITFIRSRVSPERLRDSFQFKICPNLKPLVVESNQFVPTNTDVDSFPTNSNIPTDAQLDTVRQLIGDRDYTRLASFLGILEYDLQHLEHVFRADKDKIVFNILREWKQKNGARASIGALKKALQMAGFTDIFNKMEFG